MMAYGTTLNSSPVLTDDNQPWPEDQPPASSSYANVGPQTQQSPYYLVNLAKSLWSGATYPGDVATSKASVTDPDAMNRIMDLTGLAMAPVAPAEDDALNAGFRLYHGTAAKFEKPSTDFINTGQGAQSYGWGLYGAEAEPVALDMREQLRRHPAREISDALYDADVASMPRTSPSFFSKLFAQDPKLAQYSNDPRVTDLANQAVQEMKAKGLWSSESTEAFGKLEKLLPPSPGYMQEWEVDADPSHFLDWDAPIMRQSPHVQQALQQGDFWSERDRLAMNPIDHEAVARAFGRDPISGGPRGGGPTGQNVHSWLVDYKGFPGATQTLDQLGIPGIKTLDAHSRAGVNTGILTRNFVISNADRINVVRHYNAAGAPATFGNMFNDKPGQTP